MTYKEHLRRQARKYCRDLDNYRTVIKDTNNRVNEVMNTEYNCMGYAFGVFDWLDCDDFYCLCDDCASDNSSFDPTDPTEEEYERLNDMTNDVARELERRFPIRAIRRPEAALPHERVIAMRCGFDDFHFARLNSDGVWTHKPGGNVIREMSEDELYGWAWCENRQYPYTSKIYFFAIEASLDIESKYWDEED